MQFWIGKGSLEIINLVLDHFFSLHDSCAQVEDQKQERKQPKSLLNSWTRFQFWIIRQNPAEQF